MVSIIIPVYNVKDYIDECLQSIVNQTYKELEIILINDGSTDGSAEKCLEWQAKDERIVYVSKKNETQGPTRNLGIRMAKGEYISFVDADDWIDTTMIEKLYQAITQSNADMAECDFIKVDCRTNIHKKITVRSNMLKKGKSKKERISRGLSYLMTGLYKKSLWLDNNILMPAIPYEDIATYSLIVALSAQNAYVDECLYYYRAYRENSTVNTQKNSIKMADAFRYLIKGFQDRELFSEYYQALMDLSVYEFSKQLNETKKKCSEEERNILLNAFSDFLDEEFPEWRKLYQKSFICYGSFNLSQIVNNLVLDRAFTEGKYQFSSLISLMSVKPKKDLALNHDNLYRKDMLRKDITKQLLEDLKQNRPDYLLIDFLEERYNIAAHEGVYYTESDAFLESSNTISNYSRISSFSKEFIGLWEDSCLRFIQFLKSVFVPKQIILVRMYLSEGYGSIDKDEAFEDIEGIREINRNLKNCYDFFERHYKGIRVIDVNTIDFYTDKDHIFGCYPWHLNDFLYYNAACKIREIIRGDSI